MVSLGCYSNRMRCFMQKRCSCACANDEGLYQPAHSRRLIKAFVVRVQRHLTRIYRGTAKDWSECADAQDKLSLIWPQMRWRPFSLYMAPNDLIFRRWPLNNYVEWDMMLAKYGRGKLIDTMKTFGLNTVQIWFTKWHSLIEGRFIMEGANHDALLTLSTLGKIFSRRNFEIVFLFFPENRMWHILLFFFLEN